MNSSTRSWPRRLTYFISHKLVRWVGRVLFGLRFQGVEYFPKEGGALVCCNHQSYLDPVLVGAFCHRRLNYLAREDLFQSVGLGSLIRWYDAIPVNREGMGIGGLKESLRRLRRGELVLIFPEGTRTETGDVSPLRPGFCVLARRAGVPLVPVAIAGAFEAWPRNYKWPRLRRIGLVAGEPISIEQIESRSDDELVEELEARIRSCHRKALQLL